MKAMKADSGYNEPQIWLPVPDIQIRYLDRRPEAPAADSN
jgi:hypothetical protein